MNLLAIETATEACSVALLSRGRISKDHRLAPQQHARLLLPMINALLDDAEVSRQELDAVVYGRGPGSFTGVRIAAAATQGIAFALDIPTVGVSSLQAIAQGAHQDSGATQVIAMIDARMNEVYWGAYVLDSDGTMQVVEADKVCQPESVSFDKLDSSLHWVCAGSGADKYFSLYDESFFKRTGVSLELELLPERWPAASAMLQVAEKRVLNGDVQTAADAIPVYIRDKVALTEQERRDKPSR